MPNYDYLANELAQNSSRRKQRCPRPVKAKRRRGRPRKSDPNGNGNGTTARRSTPRRKSAHIKEVIEETEEEEKMEEEEEEETQEDVNDKDDPEFVVILMNIRLW